MDKLPYFDGEEENRPDGEYQPNKEEYLNTLTLAQDMESIIDKYKNTEGLPCEAVDFFIRLEDVLNGKEYYSRRDVDYLKYRDRKRKERECEKETELKSHNIRTLSSFAEWKPDFVWYPYLPRGEYSVFFAAGGTGKSYLLCSIIAMITNGEPLPGEYMEREPQRVLFISAEDTGDLLKTRVEACGGNTDLVSVIDCCDSKGLNFATDAGCAELNIILGVVKPSLVILDPWHAFLGTEVDVNRINEMRPALQRLPKLAKDNKCAIVLVSHVNKREQGKNANNAASGSGDLINAARSALTVINSDDPNEEDVRILIHTKSNYAKAGKSLRFVFNSCGALCFDGFSDITKGTLELADRTRKAPGELAQKADRTYESNGRLINAIRCIAVPGKRIIMTYSELEETNPGDIYGSRQPKRALDDIASQLLPLGITLTTGIQVNRRGIQSKGFRISCIDYDDDPEQAEQLEIETE